MTLLDWGHDALPVRLHLPPDEPPTVLRWGGRTADAAPYAAVEILTVADGRARASQRLVDTAVGAALRTVKHEALVVDGRHTATVHLAGAGLEVEWTLSSYAGVAAATATATVRNAGEHPVVLLAVTPLVCPAGVLGDPAAGHLDLVHGTGNWLGETRWRSDPLADLAPDLSLTAHGQDPRNTVAVVSRGTWSTGTALPGGVLVHRDGPALAWQVEHNGPWRWEVGDTLHGAYLAAGGPTDVDHQFSLVLAPGESFTAIPVTLAAGDGLAGAVAALTAHRRAAWRPHPDRAHRPVVFNDYMNTLNGDPTTERLLPLVDAAADVGAEVFCIDAGWYDDGGDWWDSVGAWEPSTTRFPGGIGEVLDRIRGHGMTPGLWLEPEVVGVRSPVADRLPAEAFLSRHGQRLVEHDRYHLDLRHPAAREHLDRTVDRLVAELGVGYLKLDYNIDPGPGTDRDADSAGAGLLAHARAYLEWVDGVLDRHPRLVLENCASGGMRADAATLAHVQLQSTSDQQDPVRYPPIAAAAPLSMPPEQAASWAYPQPSMDAEQIAFTLCTSLLGRFYLSGFVDAMSAAQRALVGEAVAAHRAVAPEIAVSVPSWPAGLPDWDAPWTALALHTPDGGALLSVWRRGPDPGVRLDLPALRGRAVAVEHVFPTSLTAWPTTWDSATGTLTVTAVGPDVAARTLRLRPA